MPYHVSDVEKNYVSNPFNRSLTLFFYFFWSGLTLFFEFPKNFKGLGTTQKNKLREGFISLGNNFSNELLLVLIFLHITNKLLLHGIT